MPLALPVSVETESVEDVVPESVEEAANITGEVNVDEAWARGFLGVAAEGQLTMTLRSNGYRADCPSLWVFQGLHTLSSKVNAFGPFNNIIVDFFARKPL
jgi:hypothetical protein